MALSSDDAAMLTGFFEAVDCLRSDLETKWGAGRLELLTGLHEPALLARFRRQQQTWRTALKDAWDADYLTRDAIALVEQKSGSMQRGWRAMDERAEELGHRPVAPWVWEVRLEDGTVAAFVQSDAEASKVIAEGRFVAVYTAEEVANLINVVPNALKVAKIAFPGAKLQPPDPYRRSKEAIPFDDPIPFGDSVQEDDPPF